MSAKSIRQHGDCSLFEGFGSISVYRHRRVSEILIRNVRYLLILREAHICTVAHILRPIPAMCSQSTYCKSTPPLFCRDFSLRAALVFVVRGPEDWCESAFTLLIHSFKIFTFQFKVVMV